VKNLGKYRRTTGSTVVTMIATRNKSQLSQAYRTTLCVMTNALYTKADAQCDKPRLFIYLFVYLFISLFIYLFITEVVHEVHTYVLLKFKEHVFMFFIVLCFCC